MSIKRRQRHLRAALSPRRLRTSRVRPGVPPGTLTAAESAQPPVIHVITFAPDAMQERRGLTFFKRRGWW
jgi:hypothetical protein